MPGFLRTVLLVWMTSLTIGFGVLLWLHVSTPAPVIAPTPTTAKFESIQVQRIDVVEPDGKPRLILSNKKTAPGIVWKGVEYPHPGREASGILFFNDDGSEAGGMTYTSNKANKEAGAIITMDQYDQDQTIALVYQEQEGRRGAGLMVFDRPEQSLLPWLEAVRDVTKATGDQKAAAEARLADIEKQSSGQSAMRLMVGKQSDEAQVLLADKQSRPRIIMKVDAKGSPSLEFFDEAGKLLKHLP